MIRRHPVAAAIFASILIFILGFGVLFVFYVNMPHEVSLPGLFDYYASAIGDSICLPVLVGSLMYLHLSSGKLSKKNNIVTVVVGGLCGLVGLLIQLTWIRSDYTGLNWTIPELHHFNAPGWYHACFFIFMFILIGGLFARYCFSRVYSIASYDINWPETIAQTLLWFSGGLFLLLHNLDNYTTNHTFFRTIILTMACEMAIGIFINAGLNNIRNIGCIIKGRKTNLSNHNKVTLRKQNLIPVLSGIMTAFALANIIYGKVEMDFSYIVSCALLIIVLVVPDQRHLKQMVLMYAIIAAPTLTLEMAISTQHDNLLNMLIIFLFAVVTPCSIAACQKDNSGVNVLRKGIFATITVMIYISILVIVFVLRDRSDYSDLFEMLLNFVLVYAIPMYVKSTFKHIIDAEDQNDAVLLKGLQPIMYGLYICLYVGAAILIFRTLLPDLIIFQVGQLAFDENSWIGLVITVIAVGLCIILRKKGTVENSAGKRCWGCIAIAIAYVGIICFLWIGLSNTGIVFNEINGIKWIIELSVFMWFGLSTTLALGFRANMCLIRGVPVNGYINIAAVILWIGIALVNILGELQMVCSYSIIGIVVNGVCMALATVLFPFLIGKVLEQERPKLQLVVNTPGAGILQDGALFGMLALMCQLLTVFFVGEISKTGVNLSSISGIIITGVVYLALISWPLQYCLRNNIQHYEKRKKAKVIGTDLIKALLRHLQTQSINTLIIAFPYSLYMIIAEVFSHAMSEEKGRNIIYRFIPHDENIEK